MKTKKQAKTGPIAKKSVSLPEDLLVTAQQVAAADGRTFSNYVTRLIAADVAGKKLEEVAS